MLKRQLWSAFANVSRRTHLPSTTELYETDFRWLFNEAQQKELRRVHFDVSELIRVACAAVGTGSCLSMHRIAEGAFNKVFRLHFDNSQSLIARIPSSRMFGSGISWAIASEVATMTVVRNNLDIRTPRVIAWNKHSDTHQNPVGWPYILMEDIEGISLGTEWVKPEMRGEPVAKLLTEVANDMHRMAVTPFSQLGSLYFPADLPSVPAPAAPMGLENQVRVGPIADPMWWRFYHDEPHLDRGPWDTVEDYINAAVRIERRAVERHRKDPSSLSYTDSSVDDLVRVDHLLDKVEALAPHLQRIIERTSPFPDRSMQNILLHHDLGPQNLMVPKLTAENSTIRMKDPVFIDWQGASVLPLALQWYTPPLVKYEPRLFHSDGRPVFSVNDVSEVPWPPYFDFLDPKNQESYRAEHRLAMRNVRWNEFFRSDESYASLMSSPFQHLLHILTFGILRACVDGPMGLMLNLVQIKRAWDKDRAKMRLGPCPYTIEPNQLRWFWEECTRLARFNDVLPRVLMRIGCTRDGRVRTRNYETSMRELDIVRAEWDEEACGGPFPFEDGRWGQDLR